MEKVENVHSFFRKKMPKYGRPVYVRTRRYNPYRRPGGGRRYGRPGRRYRKKQYGKRIALPESVSKAVDEFFGNLNTTYDKTKTGTSGVGVTSQYDRKTVYYKKNMPRWKKRKWIGFVKKVEAAELKGIGTKTVVRNALLEGTITPANVPVSQGMLNAVLYGADGGADGLTGCGFQDLKVIFSNDLQMDAPTNKGHFASAVLDATLINASTYPEGGVADANYGNLEVDVYEFVMTRKTDATGVGGIYADAALVTESINGAGTSLEITQRGVTPFDLPDALSRGIKIMKKTKYFLSPGQTATYQMRDPKNYVIRRDAIDDNDENFARPKLTKGITVIYKCTPVSTGDPTKIPTAKLRMGVTRKYMYKVTQDNTDQDQLIN